jgi:transcriptional regulator with XRE-family HTH domain
MDTKVLPASLATPRWNARRLLTPAVAAQLQAARRRQGRSVEDVARSADVSPSFVRKLEQGQRAPSLVTARALIVVLALPLDVAQALVEQSAPDAGRSR